MLGTSGFAVGEQSGMLDEKVDGCYRVTLHTRICQTIIYCRTGLCLPNGVGVGVPAPSSVCLHMFDASPL